MKGIEKKIKVYTGYKIQESFVREWTTGEQFTKTNQHIYDNHCPDDTLRPLNIGIENEYFPVAIFSLARRELLAVGTRGGGRCEMATFSMVTEEIADEPIEEM
jgi:hypothetical protein